jgi:hypothetical protein
MVKLAGSTCNLDCTYGFYLSKQMLPGGPEEYGYFLSHQPHRQRSENRPARPR